MIREQRTKEKILSTEQINNIVERIMESHKEQKAPCRVKCEEIIEDYAELMAQIEEMSECQSAVTQIEEKTFEEKTTDEVPAIEKERVLREMKLSQVIGGIAAGFALAFGLGVAATKTIKKM